MEDIELFWVWKSFFPRTSYNQVVGGLRVDLGLCFLRSLVELKIRRG